MDSIFFIFSFLVNFSIGFASGLFAGQSRTGIFSLKNSFEISLCGLSKATLEDEFIDHIYQPLRSDRIWHKVSF